MEWEKEIQSLRMERQFLLSPADEEEYRLLFRDLQPGLSVYWQGFGQPPCLSYRAAFDDLAFNRERQGKRELIKGRFVNGNLGWIESDDLALFAGLYRKPLEDFSGRQSRILELLRRSGPLNIQQIKEETGLLVKEITPVLHRLQEAFLVYEDQYDGEWDRGWYCFEEFFPDADLTKYSRLSALSCLLQRFAYRFVWFDLAMARAFYRVKERDLKEALEGLVKDGILVAKDGGFLLREDVSLLSSYSPKPLSFICILHRNDPLYRAFEPSLKAFIEPMSEGLSYDHEPLQYLFIDGRFCGAVLGHFRNGPYDLNDVVLDLPDAQTRREEIIAAVCATNPGRSPIRFMGELL